MDEVNKQQEVEGFKPQGERDIAYSTKDDFKHVVQGNRHQGTSDTEAGQIPTDWQKKLLVITNLYSSSEDIPKYVHNGTMNQMHQRIRAIVIVTASIMCLTTLFISRRTTAAKIARDPDAGVIVQKKKE
uniref:Uncharacterized protein n=1 Tax=Caenorhabditis japonica TaxID=281687 RepID=K7H831_CAEJA